MKPNLLLIHSREFEIFNMEKITAITVSGDSLNKLWFDFINKSFSRRGSFGPDRVGMDNFILNNPEKVLWKK